MFTTLESTLNEFGGDDDDTKKVVHFLPNISGKILAKILEFCKHHHRNHYEESSMLTNQYPGDFCIASWEREFVDVDKDTLFEITKACHSLGFQYLLNLCTRTIARILRECKSFEDMQKYIGTKNG